MNNIKHRVFAVIEDICMTSIEDTSKKLIDDLSLDSLRMVVLLVNIEDTFGIELDESDLDPFMLITVGDVVELVSKYLSYQGDEEND